MLKRRDPSNSMPPPPPDNARSVEVMAQPRPPAYLAGKLAVQAALTDGHRTIHRLLVADSLPSGRRLPFIERAESRNIPVEFLSPTELTERSGVQNHGGIVAEAGPRVFSSADELLSRL